MGPAIDALEVAIMERKLIHGNIPILNWSVSNAVATTDPARNRKMDKEKARFRIDGAVALAMCYIGAAAGAGAGLVVAGPVGAVAGAFIGGFWGRPFWGPPSGPQACWDR
jgi:hypothetical protein